MERAGGEGTTLAGGPLRRTAYGLGRLGDLGGLAELEKEIPCQRELRHGGGVGGGVQRRGHCAIHPPRGDGEVATDFCKEAVQHERIDAV